MYKLIPGPSAAAVPGEQPPEGSILNGLGVNAALMPEKLQKCTENITGERTDEWYLYLPDSYDGTKPVPLVLALHGGRSGGLHHYQTTSWAMVAEREGFIACFPSHPRDQEWIELADGLPKNGPDDYGLRFLKRLIEVLCERYAIDRGKIYMNGMSAGCVTTLEFAKWYGNLLAGCAEDAGPSIRGALFTGAGEPIAPAGPVPAYLFQGELDSFPSDPTTDRQELNRYNREYYRRIDRCTAPPRISIEGDNNYAYFPGEAGDVFYRSMVERHHGQPFDNAEVIWRYLFSGMRRAADGRIVKETPVEPFTGDPEAVAFAAGCGRAYVRGEVITLARPVYQRTETALFFHSDRKMEELSYLYASAADLAAVFGFEISAEEEGRRVLLGRKDGRTLQAAEGNVACYVGDRVCALPRQAEMEDGMLFLPIRWFAESFLGLAVTERDGALYCSTRGGRMSKDMAVLLRETLG